MVAIYQYVLSDLKGFNLRNNQTKLPYLATMKKCDALFCDIVTIALRIWIFFSQV